MALQTVYLVRTKSTQQGTPGVLYLDQKRSWVTLELPDLNNLPRVSCIPVGRYRCSWSFSPRFQRYTYILHNVPGRGHIRIHSGNWAGLRGKYRSHSLGCPLLGKKIGILRGQLAVLSSRLAVQEFERAMKKQDFILEVRYA